MGEKGWVLLNSNNFNPFLTDVNKITHLQLEKSFLNPRNQRFDTMYDYVNIDEKWFYMTKVNTNFYLVPVEKRLIKHVKVSGILPRLRSCVQWISQDGTVMPIVGSMEILASGIFFFFNSENKK